MGVRFAFKVGRRDHPACNPFGPAFPSDISGDGPPSFANSSHTIPRIISYNVNSLSYYASDSTGSARRQLIQGALSDFINTNDIICLQETNLAPAEAHALSNLKGCLISRNNLSMGRGGTAIIDSPSLLTFFSSADVPLPAVTAGHIQLRRYHPRDSLRAPFQLLNVYFKSGGDFEFNARLIDALLTTDNALPTFLCGDLNFIEATKDTTSPNPLLPPSSFLEKWSNLRAHFHISDLDHDSHTYYHVTADPCSPYSHTSRLDRFLVPTALTEHLTITPTVDTPHHHSNLTCKPQAGSRRSFSDHLPIQLSYSCSSEEPTGGNRPTIPQWVATSPEFEQELRRTWTPNSSTKNSFSTLASYKRALFAASKTVLKAASLSASSPLRISQHICLYKLLSAPKQDLPRINRLINIAPHLLSSVKWNEGRWVSVGLEEATRALIAATITSSTPSLPSSPLKNLASKAPNARARISSLRANQDDPQISSAEGQAALAKDYWGAVWQERTPAIAPSQRTTFLKGYHPPIDHTLLHLPLLEDVLAALKCSNNSTPGPDGIPFAAWRAATDISAPILLNALTAICKGRRPPDRFNFGLLFLLPKKSTGLIADTRPLSVTNTDNRLLAAVIAHSIMPALLSYINPAQKGFLTGVNGMEHTTDINTFFYEGVENADERFLFLLDTKKAFDSIDHAWILQVLAKVGFPYWVVNFVKGALHNVKVSPFFGRTMDIWIDILRGVKQGCPLSPLLFLIAYDPLLHLLAPTPFVRSFAFADDLAIISSNILHIYPALSLISTFSTVSGMGVNKDKSGVITTSPPSRHDYIRNALLHSPWPDLNLKPSGTHLGIPIGRLITLDDIWSAPLSKLLARVSTAKSFVKSLPIALRVLYVNVFIISLLSYTALFYILPTELWKIIKHAISNLIIPFHGGAYTYESLVTSDLIFSFRPALKDAWAFNASLLAIRSPLISSTLNYNDLPSIDLTSTKLISKHRDAAAVDFWRGHHLSDGTLIPVSPLSSSTIYQSIIQDVYLDASSDRSALKTSTFLSANSPSPVPPAAFEDIITNLHSARRLPQFLLAHQFSLSNNSLATSRRMRHQNHLALDQVPACFFCHTSQDSLTHIYSECQVVIAARLTFFQYSGLDCPPPSSATPPATPSATPSATPPTTSSATPSATLSATPPPPSSPSLAAASLPSPPPEPLPTYPLSAAFLIQLKPEFVIPTIVFNFAVWRYRLPAKATHGQKDKNWLVARIVEVAAILHRGILLKNTRCLSVSDESADAHTLLIDAELHSTAICYTDGSASPNPGPSGSAASIFLQNPDRVIDMGASLGRGSNNQAELYALGMCLSQLLLLSESLPHLTKALIFSDSQLAIRAATSIKPPLTNIPLTIALRKAYTHASKKLAIRIHWIRGHSDIGGNERVDRISKSFAQISSNVITLPPPSFPASTFTTSWPFSFPLSNIHSSCFLTTLPVVRANPITLPPTPSTSLPSPAVPAPTVSRKRPAVQSLPTRRSQRTCNSAPPAHTAPPTPPPPPKRCRTTMETARPPKRQATMSSFLNLHAAPGGASFS